MKGNGWIWIPILGVGGLVAYKLYRTADAAGHLQARLVNVDFGGANAKEITLIANVAIFNPSGWAVTLDYFQGNIRLYDTAVGAIGTNLLALPPALKDMMTLSPNTESLVKIPIKISTQALGFSFVANLVKALTSGQFKAASLLPDSIEIDGYVKANKIRANFNQKVQIRKPKTAKETGEAKPSGSAGQRAAAALKSQSQPQFTEE